MAWPTVVVMARRKIASTNSALHSAVVHSPQHEPSTEPQIQVNALDTAMNHCLRVRSRSESNAALQSSTTINLHSLRRLCEPLLFNHPSALLLGHIFHSRNPPTTPPPAAGCNVWSPTSIPPSIIHILEFQVLIASTLNPKLTSDSTTPSQDEAAALYKIDYGTALPQPDSKLCTVPDEVLLEIGKHVFDGFGLEYRYGH